LKPHKNLTVSLPVLALCFAVARAPAARAAEDDPTLGGETGAGSEGTPESTAPETAPPRPPPPRSPEAGLSFLETYYPPPVDGPELRLPESPTRLYVDGAYASSSDLSALQLIRGSGKNVRFSVGGAWRWHRFAFEGEVPFVQITTLNVTALTGGQPPIPEDAKQTGSSFGDARVGVNWTQRLVGDQLVGGFGLRSRLATHTTNFSFHLQDGSLLTFVFPYYFHIEPTAILGGAIGRFIFVVNEGLDVFWGPDGTIEGQLIVVPTIVFWDSHVAVSYSPWDFLGASVEFGTDIQVNDVNDPQFPIQNIRSAWLAPAVQIHLADWRVDLVARLGLTGLAAGTEAFGVLQYIGTNSYTLRVGRSFN
jgi:hypothetical protein